MHRAIWQLHESEAVDAAPGGADRAHFADLCRLAVHVVRRLPRAERRVFRLRWRRLGYPEIANRLGISQGTARKYYSEARRLMTVAILCGSCLLLAMVGPVSSWRPAAVAPGPVRLSAVVVSPVAVPMPGGSNRRVRDLSVGEAEALLAQLLDE